MFSSAPSARVVLVLAFAVLVGCGGGGEDKAAGKRRPAAPPVVVAQAQRTQVPLEIRAIGNVEPYSAVEVKSQVAGQIARVTFEEGQDVQKGQLLFQIDPREYEQAVREMQAQVASAQAALGQAEANYERALAEARNARSQAQRYADLSAKGIISREQNEQYQTQALAAEKGGAASKAAIASAQAALQGAESKLADARLQLSYTSIRAPIAGRTGNLALKTGNLVALNATTPLVVINQVTPAYVTFTIPQQQLEELRRYSTSTKLPVNVLGGQPGQTTMQVTGMLDFLDNEIDPATGTIRLKARFANQDRKLWPGQFVNVAVRLAEPTATVVPTAAVRTAQVGSYVFVVKPDSTAEQRTIQTERAWGDVTVVASGINPGERVITEGQLRVKPGDKVQIVRQGEPGDGARARTESTAAAVPGQ